jgi:putative addiction module component (TIGR02574 family)
MSFQELREQALKLPPADREALADDLMASLTDEPLDPELEAELNRRYEELVSGKVRGIPAEQVFAELKEAANEGERRISSRSKE